MSGIGLLDSSTSHNFIAVLQVIKFSNSIQKSLVCSDDPMEKHLAENFLVFAHQIVHLLL